MAAITVKLTEICPGGNHLEFELTGAKTATVPMLLVDLMEEITKQDAEAFCRVITRMARIGRTNTQARVLLQAGVTIIV